MAPQKLERLPVATTRVGGPLVRAQRLRAVVVVNAHASRARSDLAALATAEVRSRGADATMLVTESAKELAALVADDPDRRFVLVGGDGTVHAAANLGRPCPELALIPAGRANNIARSLGIPLNAVEAARLAVEGRVRPVDAIEARTPWWRQVVVEGVSVGFLSQARSLYHEENSAHVASALAAGAHALMSFHPVNVRVKRRSCAQELALAQLFVANLAFYGFGLRVAPDADPTDSLLDVVAIEAQGRPGLLPMIARLRHATELDRPEAHHWLAERARVDTRGVVPVIADSVDLGPGVVDLQVLPRELRLVRP